MSKQIIRDIIKLLSWRQSNGREACLGGCCWARWEILYRKHLRLECYMSRRQVDDRRQERLIGRFHKGNYVNNYAKKE